jgi:hypothetical protein
VTVKVHVVAMFAASVAEQVTVVVPRGNDDPVGGEQTTATFPQLSEAVAGG